MLWFQLTSNSVKTRGCSKLNEGAGCLEKTSQFVTYITGSKCRNAVVKEGLQEMRKSTANQFVPL